MGKNFVYTCDCGLVFRHVVKELRNRNDIPLVRLERKDLSDVLRKKYKSVMFLRKDLQ